MSLKKKTTQQVPTNLPVSQESVNSRIKKFIAGTCLVVFLGTTWPPPAILTKKEDVLIIMPKIFNTFEDAMTFLWDMEGGFSDDKDDPGGATNLGITLDTARDSKLDMDGDGDVDIQDVKKIDIPTAIQVYRAKYWNVINGDSLPWDLAIAAFDAAVNCGAHRAAEWVRRAQGTKNPLQTLNELRRSHYGRIISVNPSLSKYKNGWYRRVNELVKYIEVLRQDREQNG